jgi:radical SAM superfamily enzyme YgiQ (UPF0313 family)
VLQSRAGALPHLGLGYIHAALERAGFEVATIDAQVEELAAEELRARLAKFNPALVGVTTTTPGFPGALQACEIAHQLGAKVILGGPHTEALVKENLEHAAIDFVGVGEGVSTMVELARRMAAGTPLAGTPGLVGRTFSSPPAPMLPLQDLGRPQRGSPPISSFKSLVAKHPFTTMISSRGCPFQCSFCFKQAVDKKSYFRDAEDIVDEMEHLVSDFGVREIMFYDDVFTMKRKRVYEICDEIDRRKLRVRWEAPTRVDIVDAEMLKAMAKAGCIRLRYGIESGSPRILAHMGKMTDLKRIRAAIRETHAAGIQTFGYFIVGYLDETEEEFDATVRLAIESGLDYASFYAATPLPGTRLFREAAARGLVSETYWQDYVAGRITERVPYLVPDAEQRARLAYRRFYLRPKRIGVVARSMAHRGMFMKISSGLLSLGRSQSNVERDM